MMSESHGCGAEEVKTESQMQDHRKGLIPRTYIIFSKIGEYIAASHPKLIGLSQPVLLTV